MDLTLPRRIAEICDKCHSEKHYRVTGEYGAFGCSLHDGGLEVCTIYGATPSEARARAIAAGEERV